MNDPQGLRRILLALFAVSGFSGLIYESIWSHYLKLMLGHAAYAQTLVLAIFMGGMAAGAWLASRYSERWSFPLAAYALIEGLVGLLALTFHGLFTRVLETLYAEVLPALEGAAVAGLVKWSVAGLLILPQSVLLGMTFPLMSAAIIRVCPREPGSTLALTYFTNSIGACAGVLASGFLLVPWSGLPGTITIAGSLNVGLAVAAWRLSRRGRSAGSRAASRAPASGGRLARGLLAASLLTGVASFFYEIGWIRMLSLVLGTTTQAFELMLSAFILGLALGGLWVRRRIDRMGEPLRFAARVQLLMGVFALLTLPLYAATFDVMAFLIGHLDKTDRGYAWFHLGSHLIASCVMLPATLMAGMTLPLFTVTLLRRGLGERSIGRVYAANTIGAIGGVLVAVHVVLPTLGTKGLIVSGAAVDVLLGLALFGAVRERLGRFELPAAVATAAIVLTAIGFGVQLDPRRTASGVYRYGMSRLPQGSEVVFHRDGKTATVDLIRDADGAMRISTNGKPDAQIAMSGTTVAADEVTMALAAALPLSLHPRARQVANIGLGSGLTTHTLLAVDSLERVDTIEIEAAMAEASRGFGPFVERTYSDPRSHVHIEDAKTFFASRKQTYDVVVSEPSNPWVSGVASLFTEEFYHDVAGHLAPDGLLVQWLQLYETDLDIVASILVSLSSSFRDYTVFNTDNANVIVIATNGGDLDRLDGWIFDQPAMRRDLVRVGIRRLADLEMRRIGSRSLLEPFLLMQGAHPNSDYYPYVSLHAPRARYLGSNAADLTRLHVAPVPVAEMLDPYVRHDMGPPAESEWFTPSRMYRIASDLVTALSTPGLPASTDAGIVKLIDGLPEACAEGTADETRLVERWIWLAAACNPYQRGARLDRMWDGIAELTCDDSLSPRAAEWLRLHRAVGRRDAGTMLETAERLLDSRPAGAREIEYLVTAGLSGALAARDEESARRMAARFSRLYPAGQVPPFYLRLLLARI